MWAVLTPARRARLFCDYIAAVRFYVRQDVPVSLWTLAADRWEPIAWRIDDRIV